MLCGERKGNKVQGFDLGNSPLEYTPERVSGKTIVLTTTNGTKALDKAVPAKCVIVLSLRNLSAVAEFLLKQNANISVFASGTMGKKTLEDDVCAGLLIAELLAKGKNGFQLGINCESVIDQAFKWKTDLFKMMYASRHGQYLADEGFSGDLEFCSQLNTTELIPIYRKGKITKWQKEENQKRNLKNPH